MAERTKRGALGVCSWSLRAESPADLVSKVSQTGCDAVQLALDPIRRGEWDEDETFDRLGSAGIRVASAMMEMQGEDYSSIEAIARTGGVRPDATWPDNARAGEALAEIAGRRGIKLVTFHAGFLPHDPHDAERQRMLERLRELAAFFFDSGTSVGLETGQEDADTLLGVLNDLKGRGVGVNFDPANMLLYGSGDPVESLRKLAPHVVQVHIKDATPSPAPMQWGEEVVVGTGAVDWTAFFAVVDELLPTTDLMIEREAGDNRVGDIEIARRFVEQRFANRGRA
jgi:L-ribulose-5-phosphate 3-epimerase